MAHYNDIIEVKLSDYDFRVAEYMAGKAEIGGVSRIFSDKKERLSRMKVDSLVGQLGTLAGTKLFLGGIGRYIEGRYMQNKTLIREMEAKTL